ncbi:pneumococcal-type histidine triad protein [Streptococcus sp. E17BB]|uniref:pneumococcal-type histidine triad protein n=1 Tax=Streptococcus sp. E17BB TaxID=3278714 RepID=UPI00359D61B9
MPTSDGFILTDQSKILSHTRDGIVVDHNGHSHFIFYADLQGTKFAHLIPAGTVVTAAPTQQKPQGDKQQTTADHHYEFNPADIVAEDALGYTVRHGDHYHYVLKSSLSNQQQAAATTHVQTTPLAPSTGGRADQANPSQQGGIAGIDFPTSDGFLFDGTGVHGWTEAGLLVNHDRHLHVLLTSDLARSKWAYLLRNSSTAPSMPSVLDKPTQPSSPIPSEQPTVPSGSPQEPNEHHQDEVAVKRAYLAQATGLSENQIVLLNTPDGPGFMYPHDDHTHFVLLSKLDITKSYDDGHGNQVKPAVPENPQVPTSPSLPAQPSTPEIPAQLSEPKPSERDELEAKRQYLAEKLGLRPEAIQVTDGPTGRLFIYPHDNHHHAIAVDKVVIGEPIEDPHADPHAHQAVGRETLKAIGFDEEIIADILHADAPTPFPADETDPEKMKAWLATVTSLNIGQRQDPLKRFGLDLMPNLETLGVGFTPIDDVRPILQFKKLKNLFLTKTGITDYSFLKELPQLEGLDASQNSLTSLAFLKDYPQLKTLALAGNDLTDISALDDLPNLEFVNLDYNRLTDLSALSQANHLKVLSVEHNQLKDLSILSNKSELQRIFVSHNKGLDLSTLQAPNLEELTAEHNELTNLNFVSGLPSLVSLSVGNNAISDLSGLEKATQLRTLNVSDNQVTSLHLPASQASLDNLNISNNLLTTLEGIQNFSALTSLNAGHNHLNTLVVSQPNKTITFIEVNDNHIPAEELTPNSQNIPQGIAQYFPAAEGGNTSNNTPNELTEPADEVAAKRAYLARETGLSEDKITVLETKNGPGFMYPHDDHIHFVLLRDLDITKPYDDGHSDHDQPADSEKSGKQDKPTEQEKLAVAPKPSRPEKPAVPPKPSRPKPSPAPTPIPEEQETPVSTTEAPTKEGVAGIDYPTSDGFLFDGTGIEGWTDAGLMVDHKGHTHILPKDAIARSKWVHLLPKETPKVQAESPVLSEKQAKQRAELAQQLGLPVESIRPVTADGKVVGFEYPHEDHTHIVHVTEEAPTKAPLTDEEKRELTAYIRKAYGLLQGTPVHFHDSFVVFAIPHPHQDYDAKRDYYTDVLDPLYDAGHVHPYSVPLDLLTIPAKTDNLELDFENELQAAAERLGVPVIQVNIKDKKYFVLPGKDHYHYLNILTPMAGYEAYMANKLPEIKASFSAGEFSAAPVTDEIARVLEDAKSKFGETSADYRRIARALDDSRLT